MKIVLILWEVRWIKWAKFVKIGEVEMYRSIFKFCIRSVLLSVLCIVKLLKNMLKSGKMMIYLSRFPPHNSLIWALFFGAQVTLETQHEHPPPQIRKSHTVKADEEPNKLGPFCKNFSLKIWGRTSVILYFRTFLYKTFPLKQCLFSCF